MAEKILQIIPATGWYAKYKDKNGELFSPLVCWALFEDDEGEVGVRGMDADPNGTMDYADSAENFSGFIFRPVTSGSYQATATATQITDIPLTAHQQMDYEDLREWRVERAKQDGLAPFMIAHNSQLRAMVTLPVKTKDDLLKIKGFGSKRTQKYGDDILKILVGGDFDL